MKYLIDSNIIIYHLNGDKSATEFLSKNYQYLAISFISIIEVLSFDYSSTERKVVNEFMSNFTRIDINDKIISTAINLRLTKKIKLPDCIIASTALVNNATLVTQNLKDFQHIPELNIINTN